METYGWTIDSVYLNTKKGYTMEICPTKRYYQQKETAMKIHHLRRVASQMLLSQLPVAIHIIPMLAVEHEGDICDWTGSVMLEDKNIEAKMGSIKNIVQIFMDMETEQRVRQQWQEKMAITTACRLGTCFDPTKLCCQVQVALGAAQFQESCNFCDRTTTALSGAGCFTSGRDLYCCRGGPITPLRFLSQSAT